MSSNNYWTDRRQNQRIEEAEAQLASERRARNRLSQQMKEQQGNLEGQIKRLTTALVALIEHEDIRAELGQYSDAANCRRYARDVVSTVVVTGGAALRGSVVPREVPGYWLSSAAQGVAALAQGEPGGEALLTRAGQEDPERAATFLAMLGAATHDDRWASSDLARVLPGEVSVSAAQRQIWLAIADGRLTRRGGDARSELSAALRQQVQAAGDSATQEATAWLKGRAGSGNKQVPAERAADLLATLRSILEGAPAGARDDDGADDTPRLIRSMLGEDDQDATAEAPAEDPLADCLRSLIEEGSPGEGDILDRMAQARTDLGFLDEKAASMEAAWSAPVGSVLDLLLADLDQPADSPLRALAQEILTPTLSALADKLAAEAAVPPEDRTTLRVATETITVTSAGATADWKPGVITGLASRNPRNKWLFPLGVGALGVGVVSIGLAFVAPIFWLLAVLGIVVGAGLLLSELKARRDSQELQRSTLDRTERDVSRAAETLGDDAARSSVALSRATEDRRVVQDLLAQG